MKKDAESGYKIVDDLIRELFQYKNCATINCTPNSLKIFNSWTKKQKTNSFGMQYQYCLMFQIPHQKSHHLSQSKLDQWCQTWRKLLQRVLTNLLTSYKIFLQLQSKSTSVTHHRKRDWSKRSRHWEQSPVSQYDLLKLKTYKKTHCLIYPSIAFSNYGDTLVFHIWWCNAPK